MHPTATIIFAALLILVAALGFVAARWRKADLNLLHEWGLGGRRFGTVVRWFLLGGDLYTAYRFIAVPTLVYGTGHRSDGFLCSRLHDPHLSYPLFDLSQTVGDRTCPRSC